MSVPGRAPLPTVLAGSARQPDPAREDIRARLAAAWSTSPHAALDVFVLNARAHDPQLRRYPPDVVMRVARSMNLDADPAPLRKALAGGKLSAPEQAALANAMMTAAAASLRRMRAAQTAYHASRRPT